MARKKLYLHVCENSFIDIEQNIFKRHLEYTQMFGT